MWDDKKHDLRPIVPGQVSEILYWPIPADPVDEEDGGTYYRPMTANWINGSGAPGITTGDEDDFYLDTTNFEWYGPKGEENDDGEGNWPGPYALPDPGSYGVWLTGTKAPTITDGDVEDYWLDTAHHIYYGPKGATWPDGETIYDEWIQITAGPTLPGQFSFPGSEMGMENDTGGTISVYLMFRNAENQKICDDVLIAQLIVGEPSTKMTVEAADALDLLHVFTQADIIHPGAIAKVRYKIVGPDGLTWEGGGNMGKLHV